MERTNGLQLLARVNCGQCFFGNKQGKHLLCMLNAPTLCVVPQTNQQGDDGLSYVSLQPKVKEEGLCKDFICVDSLKSLKQMMEEQR